MPTPAAAYTCAAASLTVPCILTTDKVISCWHEIPLYAGEGLLHFICEIPKETSAKMEVATVSSNRAAAGSDTHSRHDWSVETAWAEETWAKQQAALRQHVPERHSTMQQRSRGPGAGAAGREPHPVTGGEGSRATGAGHTMPGTHAAGPGPKAAPAGGPQQQG